jgi:CubicO group peptidase (beta-lactamase class C family)
VAQAMAAGFGPHSAMILAFLVTYKGRILGEQYASGIGIHTPLESWSMGKSLTGTLIARLIQMGDYTLDQPAPIPQWQTPGDPRQEIRITDIMRMSSGLRIRAPQDPDHDPSLGYPDHLWYYTGAGNSFEWAATRAAAMEAQHRRALSQHGPRTRQLSHGPRGRETRRRLPHVPAACSVR